MPALAPDEKPATRPQPLAAAHIRGMAALVAAATVLASWKLASDSSQPALFGAGQHGPERAEARVEPAKRERPHSGSRAAHKHHAEGQLSSSATPAKPAEEPDPVHEAYASAPVVDKLLVQAAGPSGGFTEIELRGRGLDRVDAAQIGRVTADIVVRKPGLLRLRLPAGTAGMLVLRGLGVEDTVVGWIDPPAVLA